jgi:hypothetical protein
MSFIRQRGDHYELCHSRRTEDGPRHAMAVNLGPCQTLGEAKKHFAAEVATHKRTLAVLDDHEAATKLAIVDLKETAPWERTDAEWQLRIDHCAIAHYWPAVLLNPTEARKGRLNGRGEIRRSLTLAGIARERQLAQRRLDRAREALAAVKALQ